MLEGFRCALVVEGGKIAAVDAVVQRACGASWVESSIGGGLVELGREQRNVWLMPPSFVWVVFVRGVARLH